MNADVHSLAGPYALDALPDGERARFEEHLQECADCRAEVVEFAAVAGRLGTSVAEPPPAELKERVLAEVRTTRQVPPTVEQSRAGESDAGADEGSGSDNVRVVRRWRRGMFLAVAAAVLAIVAGGTTAVVEHQRAQDAERRTVAMTSVLAAPDARLVRGDVRGGGRATTTWSARRDAAVVVLDELPPNAEGRTYQLWLMRPDGTAAPSRTVDVPEPGRREVLLKGGLRGTTALALTVEPSGGSKAPTTDPILALPLR